MANAYSRVTVVSGTRRVDLALPNALPVSDVLPQLLRFCAPSEPTAQPVAWTLGRAGSGTDIDISNSLTDAGVLDGEVLELRSADAPRHPAYVEDVRDAVEDVTNSTGGHWRDSTTLTFLLAIAAVAAVFAALLPHARRPDHLSTVGAAVLLSALCVLGAWWAARRVHRVVPLMLLAVSCLWAGMAGFLITERLGLPAAVVIVATGLAALAAAGAARAVTSLATLHIAATGYLVGAGLVTTLAAWAWSPLTPARVAGVLTVLVVGVLPRLSTAVGGLATADYRVRRAALLTHDELTVRIEQSTMLLFGGLLAAAVVGGAAGVWLSFAGSLPDRLLGLAIAAGLLTRSRAFTRILHVTPLRVAGAVVLGAQCVALASEPVVQPWLLPGFAVLMTGLVALAVAPFSTVTRARLKRLGNGTESVVVVAMIVLFAGSIGLYDMVAQFIAQ